MENHFSILSLLILPGLFLLHVPLMAANRCPDCGYTPVPYPLSSSPNCGDPFYTVRCISGSLWLNIGNGSSSSSYLITSVDTVSQKLIIRPPGFVKNTCVSFDLGIHGFWLDLSFPFNITNRNTVLLFNCSTKVLLEHSLNCSPSSACHDFLRRNPAVESPCKGSPTCCMYRAVELINGFSLKMGKERCSAYLSFVNLGGSVLPEKWPETGVEIEWAPPREPVCRLAADCRNLANSVCSPEPVTAGQRRCLCIIGFKWDPTSGMCIANNIKIPKKGNHKHKKKTLVLLGAVAGIFAATIGALVVFIISKRRRGIISGKDLNQEQVRRQVILNVNGSGKSSRMFTSKEIEKATNSFSSENLLGIGGFGEVFKGNLDDGTLIAVKRPKLGSIKGTDQILNEVRILCQVNHRNLVRLLGCCADSDQPLLIYEFISNGNLFDHLHGNRNPISRKSPPLTLTRRLKIASQTADGLAYLHSSATPRIYHRDIKSSNILLDENLNAKVADFGLSRLAVSQNQSSHVTTGAQGTLGYLDPEYYLNFQLTDKSDVYSFGVVLLELLTSEKAIDFNREEEDVNLAVYVKKIMREERLMEIVDPVIKDGASGGEMEILKVLGFIAEACLDEKRRNRPAMKDVADELRNILSVINCQEEEDDQNIIIH